MSKTTKTVSWHGGSSVNATWRLNGEMTNMQNISCYFMYVFLLFYAFVCGANKLIDWLIDWLIDYRRTLPHFLPYDDAIKFRDDMSTIQELSYWQIFCFKAELGAEDWRMVCGEGMSPPGGVWGGYGVPPPRKKIDFGSKIDEFLCKLGCGCFLYSSPKAGLKAVGYSLIVRRRLKCEYQQFVRPRIIVCFRYYA